MIQQLLVLHLHRVDGVDGQLSFIPTGNQADFFRIRQPGQGDVHAAVHWEFHRHYVARTFFPTVHHEGGGGDIQTKSGTWTAATFVEFHFILDTLEREHDVTRTPIGFNGEHIARLFEHSEEENLATFGDADAFKRFITIELKRCSIVFPNIAICEFSHDVHARKRRFRGEKDVPPTGVGSLNAIRSLAPSAVE